MTEETANKIIVDGVEHNESDLNDKQKYYVAQLKNLNDISTKLSFQLDQITASKSVFANHLTESFKEDEKEESKTG